MVSLLQAPAVVIVAAPSRIEELQKKVLVGAEVLKVLADAGLDEGGGEPVACGRSTRLHEYMARRHSDSSNLRRDFGGTSVSSERQRNATLNSRGVPVSVGLRYRRPWARATRATAAATA